MKHAESLIKQALKVDKPRQISNDSSLNINTNSKSGELDINSSSPLSNFKNSTMTCKNS